MYEKYTFMYKISTSSLPIDFTNTSTCSIVLFLIKYAPEFPADKWFVFLAIVSLFLKKKLCFIITKNLVGNYN